MGSRLFVGNLPYTCSEEDLRAVFEARYGVVEVRIVTDRETGRSKGFGFVELVDAQAARGAIDALDGCEAFGRRLAVREAHERPATKAKPNRTRVQSKPRVAVDTMIRRGGFRPAAAAPSVSEGRRWTAPPEPEQAELPAGRADGAKPRRRRS